MADHLAMPLNSSAFRRIVPAVAGFLSAALLLSSPVLAEDLQDPTRPPAPIATPGSKPVIEPSKSAGLQSVIISKKRSAAIIDGQTIELGGKYGDVRLIEVTDTGVILQGARGRQVMSLFPDVSMSKKKVKARP